eukprot:TRINITY_DN4998_c0_g1_i1.p1 TRINITY_DN4998_c0_g1~~TRINITY_DN4998_c0_g1_i1.p1  ORF type:complete len:384 (-),score=116.97 TRINITY_DN4998_c0_g1_i1:225-1376(-)
MEADKIKELKIFIKQCEENPSVLRDPSLRFFRDYLERLGAKLPSAAYSKTESSKATGAAPSSVDESDDDILEHEENKFPKTSAPEVQEDMSSEDDIVESDVELENEGIVEPDNDPPQQMGDPTIEVTEEKRDEAQMAKGKAMEALAEGNLDEALKHLTEAVLCNPTSAILYASRASIYVKMKKPNAAIRDADAALKINPDSAKGYKARGMARAMLGHWEDAAKDLRLASRLDYDEEIAAVLKKVEPNAHKLEEHKRKYERLRKERDAMKKERERQRRRAEAQAAYEKAKQQEQASTGKKPTGTPGGFPGGMPGGFPGGTPGGMPDMSKILNDPELMAAFKDPEVMTALQDVMKNPANLAKYQANPKIAPIIAKMMGKFGGAGN